MAYLHYFSDQKCSVCGHNASFSLLHAAVRRVQQMNGMSRKNHWIDDGSLIRGLFTCGHCLNPVAIDFTPRNRSLNQNSSTSLQYLNRLRTELIEVTGASAPRRLGLEIKGDTIGKDLTADFEILAYHPDGKEVAPSSLPESIAKMYTEDLLHAVGSPRLMLFSCRSILEASCRDKLGTASGKLVKLIEKLADDGVIPGVMKDWAHTIRQFGNEAVHETEAPSLDEANEIMSFTTKLLEFIYTHPARINELRGIS